MIRRVGFFFLFWAVAVATAPSISRAREIEGQNAGGAYYRISVPDNWNGDLVIWNHGFSLSEPSPRPDLGPLVDVQLLEGYAVAASSFRLNGWALFKSTADLRQLMQVFTTEFGKPEKIILYGASLGGAVTAAALEQGIPGNVAGALTYCGAMAGSRNWDVALDLRLLYDLVCEGMPGGEIPGGAKGLPKNSAWTDDDIEDAVNACTGVNEPSFLRTGRQKKNLKTILNLAKIPRAFLVQDMLFATEAMADLVHDPRKLRSKPGTGNQKVVYGDAYVDANIRRVKPKPPKQKKLARNFTPKGDINGAKIVSMHTSKDGLVLVENQSIYAQVVPPQNLTTVIARESVATHCVFTPGEILAGWEALRDWIATGDQPSARDIQETCKAIPVLGEVCRIDADFKLPDPDKRMRPR
jgi:pimeloyl-ACP methyl ester carboxylesterase